MVLVNHAVQSIRDVRSVTRVDALHAEQVTFLQVCHVFHVVLFMESVARLAMKQNAPVARMAIT